jgi:cobyrinic acid a,c-diamide synthase
MSPDLCLSVKGIVAAATTLAQHDRNFPQVIVTGCTGLYSGRREQVAPGTAHLSPYRFADRVNFRRSCFPPRLPPSPT